MKQVCIIHGGTTYDTYDDYLRDLASSDIKYDRLLYGGNWKTWLSEELTDYDVLLPSMPNKQNAQYTEWTLTFEKVLPHLTEDTVLVGHSLGGIFLAKYLSENDLTITFKKLILIAAPYDDESSESLASFRLTSARAVASYAQEIHILHSSDDPVVPVEEAHKYLSDLPSAQLHAYNDKLHFNEPEFPELKQLIEE